jgi:hypothetical protein
MVESVKEKIVFNLYKEISFSVVVLIKWIVKQNEKILTDLSGKIGTSQKQQFPRFK